MSAFSSTNLPHVLSNSKIGWPSKGTKTLNKSIDRYNSASSTDKQAALQHVQEALILFKIEKPTKHSKVKELEVEIARLGSSDEEFDEVRFVSNTSSSPMSELMEDINNINNDLVPKKGFLNTLTGTRISRENLVNPISQPPKNDSLTQEKPSWLPASLRSSLTGYLSSASVESQQTFDCSELLPDLISPQKTFVQIFESQINSILDSSKTSVEKLKLLSELMNDPLFDAFDEVLSPLVKGDSRGAEFKQVYSYCRSVMGRIVAADMENDPESKIQEYLAFFQGKDSKSRLLDDVFKVFFNALPSEDKKALNEFFNHQLSEEKDEDVVYGVYGSLSFSLQGADIMVQRAKEKCQSDGDWAALTLDSFSTKLTQVQSKDENYTGYLIVESEPGHMTPIYVEKRDGEPLKILMTDSVGGRNDKKILKAIKGCLPTGPMVSFYHYPVLRQMDPETCLVFALRDLVQFSKMAQENPSLSVFDRLSFSEDSPEVVKELPAPMRRLVQPLRDIKAYKESAAEGDKAIRLYFKQSLVNSLDSASSKMKWVTMNPRAELRKVKYMAQVIQGYFEAKDEPQLSP